MFGRPPSLPLFPSPPLSRFARPYTPRWRVAPPQAPPLPPTVRMASRDCRLRGQSQAVCADLPDDEFRAAYTTAGGAYLLDRACARLPQILGSVRVSRQDPMAPHRRTLKEYVLGPDRLTSMERFNAAVNALADKGAAELAQDSTERHPELRVPQQRVDSVIQAQQT